jgi:hypothetical protein
VLKRLRAPVARGWHVTCIHFGTDKMATKIKIAKFVGGTRPPGRPAPPQSSVKLAGLYLLALRSHLSQAQAPAPRRKFKLTIPIRPAENGEGIPEPVKITHC